MSLRGALLSRAVRLQRRLVGRWRPLTLGVQVILRRGDEVLLVQHSYVSGWRLPGGGVEPGESLEQAARRELDEELGVQAGALQLLGVYSGVRDGRSDHVAVFVAESFELRGARSLEIDAWQMCDPGRPPADIAAGAARRLTELLAPRHAPHHGPW